MRRAPSSASCHHHAAPAALVLPSPRRLTASARRRTVTESKMELELRSAAVALAVGWGAARPLHRTPQGNPVGAAVHASQSPMPHIYLDLNSASRDADLARLFERAPPDTTGKYFNAVSLNAEPGGHHHGGASSLVLCTLLRITGLGRISRPGACAALLPTDPARATLVKAVINSEARCVAEYPTPPPESGLAPSHTDWADGVTVSPPVNRTVFECKIDSLCGFLKSYWGATKDASFTNAEWYAAVNQIFRVINEQSQPSFDASFTWVSYYDWTGGNGALSPAVVNRGNGEPKAVADARTGMVGAHHDDLSTSAFLTPANARRSVELAHLVDFLLSHLGFLEKHHPAYVATRKVLLSAGNPYFAAGRKFGGAEGPHIDTWHPWPMSQISTIVGTDDDAEILCPLYLVANNTAGLGLIPES
ncbi:Six-hairpin glycosidase-like protein [Mycena latifolia]|nr:Six-hairpin glycosidase-like protein [Mycena latifolia]